MTDVPGKRTSFLELFFDLVFVFAITQVAAALHDDHSAQGWLQAALLMWLVWWAWSQYTWAANAIDVERAGVRMAMLVVTGLTLVAAIAIPDAFAGRGALFAIPYAAVRLGGLALYWFGLRGDPVHQQALRAYLPIAVISPLLVLVGGLMPAGARAWVWLAAVLVDVVSVLAAGRGEFRVAPAHFAERHALIIIIALGESIIAIGATVMGLGIDPPVMVAVAVAFAAVALMWWAYFDRAATALEHRLVSEPDNRRRGHIARDVFTLGHLPMVAGIVLFAVGVEEALLHPGGSVPVFGRLAMGLGAFMFLMAFLVPGRPLRGVRRGVRMAAATAALVALLALPSLAGAALVAIVALLLAAVALAERRTPTPGTPEPAPAG